MYKYMFVVTIIIRIKLKIITKTLYKKQKRNCYIFDLCFFLIVAYVVSKIHLLSQFQIIIILI
jgi:hypothetical protein